MLVKQIMIFGNGNSFPVCPKCKSTFEYEYQSYCDRCGQCLNWDEYEKAEIINKYLLYEK